MPADRKIARQHADWLSLIDISGPFLSMPVLLDRFPQGLDLRADEAEVRRRVRQAYDEWADNQAGMRPEPAIHTQWLRFVLEEVLEMPPAALLEGQQIPSDLRYDAREHGETLRPLLVIRSPFEPAPRLLIQLYPAAQDLAKALPDRQWKASPATRMMELLRATGLRLGLLTNGRSWMLVHAPLNETTGYYTWDASLWAEEPLTLRAFRTLLGQDRFFNVPERETLEALLAESAQRQQEVTDQLGDQVRRAVETLVHTLDRLDKDSQRALLRSISEKALYEAALTVMMRLVFLLSAEERGMLLLGEALYDQNYAVSTLHKQLRELADAHGEEVLGLRYDAWGRLLAIFRLVYGGVEHPDLRLPAYGGHLFDPDRFPFLEGRAPATSWLATPAAPLLIDNRTVLHLLNALQYLQVKVPGGGVEPRRLSFRGLDIEQIGHVYEGLLDHTARRASLTILGLLGSNDSEPEATLDDLEARASQGEQALLAYVQEVTGRSASTLQKSLGQPLEKPQERSRLMEACDNRQELFARVLPYATLLRRDSFGNFVLVTPGSIYVTRGSDRRSTGTHYTPRSLTEPIVQHTLDPLVYVGPAEGLPREQWQLRLASEILDLKVCDMAMGSGAFLVQACRYLAEKLVEAWDNAERALSASNGQPRPQITPDGRPSQGQPAEELLPLDSEERLALARRLVSERCLYGVDKNPMAVEMAKLSLWLITLAKNKPFTFLDHALRCGDSLLGADLKQLKRLSLSEDEPGERQMAIMELVMEKAIAAALKLRREISTLLERSVSDVEIKARKLAEADEAMRLLKLGSDILVAIALSDAKRRPALRGALLDPYLVLVSSYQEAHDQHFTQAGRAPARHSFAELRAATNDLLNNRQPFHWPLEFPEAFAANDDEAGFAAIMGNPPFQGGGKIANALGSDYREYLVKNLADGTRGGADLCAYFFLRTKQLTRLAGQCGLLATNTIAQGDTREVGLDQITNAGGKIIRAVSSSKWPGTASLEVAQVWLRKGDWRGPFILDGKPAESISSFLTAEGLVKRHPYPLRANGGKAFKGHNVQGIGFVLQPGEALSLIEKSPCNQDVLFPYLNGEDVNSRPDQSPSRWVINFRDWSLEKVEAYSDCIRIVRERVKPERDVNNRQSRRERWWLYGDYAKGLELAIAKMERVLAIPRVTKYMLCSWELVGIICSDATCVIATESDSDFALIQCTFHSDWARANGSTLETRMRYTPTDCFETFPFPASTDGLDDIGERYYQHRQAIMLARQEGLTRTYNRFHEPAENTLEIVKLRELHTEMDEAVARAYGWHDLKLDHGFHQTRQGTRYTISEAARREVLDRLLLLNHQRHAEEAQTGLLAKKSSKASKSKAPKSTATKKQKVTQEAPQQYNGNGAEMDETLIEATNDVQQRSLF